MYVNCFPSNISHFRVIESYYIPEPVDRYDYAHEKHKRKTELGNKIVFNQIINSLHIYFYQFMCIGLEYIKWVIVHNLFKTRYCLVEIHGGNRQYFLEALLRCYHTNTGNTFRI